MKLENAKLRWMVDTAAELTETARSQSERDRDFYDGYQWTAADTATLTKRKQPVITDNRVRRKIDALVGLEQRGRVDPRALPRNPGDEDSADIATKALVYVDDINRLDTIRSAFCYNLGIEGYGGVEVVTKDRKGMIDPEVVRLRWEEIFYDPHSRNADFSDAEYLGVQKWMSLDAAIAFARQYAPDMDEEALSDMFEASMYNTHGGETYEDRPQDATRSMWGDRKKSRVKLAYMYYKNAGVWYLALITGSGDIYNEPSPYLDEDGQPECAIILQSCYVDRENRRHGIVRDMVTIQQEINARRSKLLHMLNTRQTMAPRGSVDVAKVKSELAKPDGHVDYDMDPLVPQATFSIIPQSDQIMGQFSLLEYSINAIDNLGPNPSILGEQTDAKSGRAIIAQQQAGMAELAPFYDAIRDWNLRVYRAIWNRIKQFWTEERWIRVTEQPDKLQFIGLNTPAMQMDPMTGQPMPVIGPDGQPVIENNVGALDVDIIIDMAPDYAVLQDEQFEKITELMAGGMLQLPPDMLIRMSSLRNKAEILEGLESQSQTPEAQQMQQMQAQMAELAMRVQAAEAMLKEAQAQKAQAEAQETMASIGQGEAPQMPDEGPRLQAQVKGAELALKAQMHRDNMALQGPLTAAEIELKRAQADKARREPTNPAAGDRANTRRQR